MSSPILRLGTRGSPLALVQARLVRAALCAAHGWDEQSVEIVPIKTTGDKVQDRALAARSEERRVGKECVSLCRSRWSPYH